tara:strand:+ start:292 stop:573 length:282 start_codon:yes stop_codon:yes gene_type:complete
MAKPKGKGTLNNWFKKEKWVDISAPKKGGGYEKCGRKSAKKSKRGYPKCVPQAKANRMTKSQIKSAVARKRANPKGKVKTLLKKKKNGTKKKA